MKDYFKDKSNLVSFCLALIPSMLLYKYAPTDTVPYGVFICSVFIGIVLLWLVAKLYFDACDKKEQNQIILKSVSDGRCICKPDGNIKVDSVVVFLSITNGVERIICYGYVETIGYHGYAQIIPIETESFLPNACSYISSHLSDIIVRPCIISKEQFYIESLSEED